MHALSGASSLQPPVVNVAQTLIDPDDDPRLYYTKTIDITMAEEFFTTKDRLSCLLGGENLSSPVCYRIVQITLVTN
jgi:hypothetical protein